MRLRFPKMPVGGLGGRWRNSPVASGGPVSEGAAGSAVKGNATAAAWLDVLCRLLRLPREETRAIRAELEEHLGDRIRDLMLEGETEDAATGKAIAELGDAAALADRFRRAEHAPRRRMLMNIALIGLASGAVFAGAIGVNRMMSAPTSAAGSQTPPSVLYASTDVASKNISLPADATIDRFVQELGRVAGKPTHVYWDMLEPLAIAKDTVIGVPMANVSVETALMLANERLGKAGERLACRVTGDLLEVSTLHHFDKRDITLMAYDATPVLGSIPAPKDRAEVAKEMQKLITGVIDAEQWRENGGDIAEMYLVGSRLFVRAPARFQPTVSWILGQLGAASIAPAAPPEASGTRKGVVPVLKDIPIIAPLFGTPATEAAPKAGASAARNDSMTFTASGNQVTAASAAGIVTADRITMAPSGQTLEAVGAGGVTVQERKPRPAPAEKQSPTCSIIGLVERPGLYALPKDGMTIRMALAASGGKFDQIREVVVSQTQSGVVTIVHQIKGDDLRTVGAADPTLSDGQIVEVK